MCRGYVEDVQRICRGSVENMQRICRGCVEEVQRICRGSVEDMQRKCRGSVEEVQRICRGSVEDMQRICRGYVENMQRICRGSVEDMQRRCRGYVGGMQRICNGYVEDMYMETETYTPIVEQTAIQKDRKRDRNIETRTSGIESSFHYSTEHLIDWSLMVDVRVQKEYQRSTIRWYSIVGVFSLCKWYLVETSSNKYESLVSWKQMEWWLKENWKKGHL